MFDQKNYHFRIPEHFFGPLYHVCTQVHIWIASTINLKGTRLKMDGWEVCWYLTIHSCPSSWPFGQICPFRMKRLEYFKKIKIACRLRVDSFQLGATILSWVSDGIWESNELMIKLILKKVPAYSPSQWMSLHRHHKILSTYNEICLSTILWH